MLENLARKVLVCVVEAVENGVNNKYIMELILFIVGIFRKASSLTSMGLDVWNGIPYSNHSDGAFRRSRIKIFQGMRVAFICDGNRRYMKKIGQKDKFTRDPGLQKIYEFINFGYFYGLKEVSFFCFALSNLRRTPEEVNGIMNIIRKKIKNPKKTSIKPKFLVYGRLDLLDSDVRNKLIEVEKETENNTDIVVNIFFAYSSEDEINRGIKFDSKVDILIRTGDAKRLSNFMVRQVATGTSVFFAKVLWPELTIVHLFLILLKHQLENKYLLN
ncbi:undecaprenyl pyrophosphatase synthetase [Encephalitozoon intestinalis ATCC 50506]|uniref:Undecaprenyl pyrophosphatase synthetase n=1 Tax=Encephalitozoon intestinalis (strain ATCC 50506) TaxID=876142 RepID=E0S983_ENCIT|nr:undecaprenyl pyrophosphatase synthetase [Encephalitozoon intestinalis ATCC 50506]ADM12318.2 undecaprenyl pyrophosphatase synthetase [Encephalitozoon intestinalis ATCC 50506]UTX46130.1 undecaprenyl pyrophosphatase synthetase [Encephalitozoon intestinalis]